MKKLSLALAVAGALGVSAAQAAVVSEFANGVLVPYFTSHNPSGAAPIAGRVAQATAVGLTSCAAGTVYWAYFNPASQKILDGEFRVTANDQANVIWQNGDTLVVDGATAGQFPGFNGFEGYFTFILDTNSNMRLDIGDQPCLSGAAFLIEPSANDVSVIPVLPLQAKNPDQGIPGTNTGGDFGPANVAGVFVPDLLAPTNTTIVNLAAGARHGDQIYMRYFVEAGATTQIFVWSAQNLVNRYSVNVFNTNQQRFSATLILTNPELNVINPQNPAQLTSLAAGFTDGFILWDLASAEYTWGVETGRPFRFGQPNQVTYGDGVFSYSVIRSPVFGAAQTVINPIRLREAPDDNNNGTPLENTIRVRVTASPQP